jgi:hypothetical protein
MPGLRIRRELSYARIWLALGCSERGVRLIAGFVVSFGLLLDIVEGANRPTSPGAERVLRERGIRIVPDILANAGE